MESIGIPAVAVCSAEFVALGQAEAEALGMPGLAIVKVPHPVGTLRQKALLQVADSVVDEIAEALTRPREQVAESYRGRYLTAKTQFRRKSLFG